MAVSNIPEDLANSPTPLGRAGPSSHLESSAKMEGESFAFPGMAQSQRSTMGPHFFQQPEEDDWTMRFATAFASAMRANADRNMRDLSDLINGDREPRPPQIKATPPGKNSMDWTPTYSPVGLRNWTYTNKLLGTPRPSAKSTPLYSSSKAWHSTSLRRSWRLRKQREKIVSGPAT
ncbi:hypothetical protein ONZ45_g9281 [Pleurotus djamor]|nr:hypothetical protein ONZ45_g9281 [Pleurotus djamor]